jgi:hypothetical protein
MEVNIMLNIILAIPLLMHGLAHVSGLLASWTSLDVGYADNPWLFSQGVYLQSLTSRIFGMLWLAAMIGLAGSGVGIITRQEWWPVLAVASAVLSLVVILPWWNTVPAGAKIGAIFNLLLLAVLLSPLKRGLFDLLS